MKKLTTILSIFLLAFLFIQCQEEPPTVADEITSLSKYTNKDPLAALPNLSFPVVATDVIDVFYQKIWVDADLDGFEDDSEWVLAYDSDGDGTAETAWTPDLGTELLVPILVTEDISAPYTGSFPGQVEPPTFTEPAYYTTYVLGDDGCFVDLVNNETGELVPDGKADKTEPILMTTWLESMKPWYPQPRVTSDPNPNYVWNTAYVSDYKNSWQADWILATGPVTINFVDWGNPIENTYPLVGYRFPVELALYTMFDEATTMTAYKMGCVENPSTATELFATSDLDTDSKTYGSYYATVLTNKFRCEVLTPSGTIERINIGPGIGPSGKMNFASASGGWVPKVPGVHRIYFYIDDPNISMAGATINDDDHYVMSTSCGPAEGLSVNKLNKSYLIGNVTWIDVLVKVANSNGGRKI